MSNIFYKCCGYNIGKKTDKPLFFYHVPKSGGTTVAVLLSHLFKSSKRISGPLFINNSKGGITAFENYNNLKNSNKLNLKKHDFLFGHLSFEINHFLKEIFSTFTIIREPISRSLSHYKWLISRNLCSTNDDVQKLFNENKLPKNNITNQFSGCGQSNQNQENAVEQAFSNIKNDIDMTVNFEDIMKFLKLIISIYDLPNLFFQNQQVNNKKINIDKKTLEIIHNNNELDLLLYSKLLKENIFYKFKNNKFEKRNQRLFLYSSPKLLLNQKKTLIIDEKDIIKVEKKLKMNDFVVKIF